MPLRCFSLAARQWHSAFVDKHESRSNWALRLTIRCSCLAYTYAICEERATASHQPTENASQMTKKLMLTMNQATVTVNLVALTLMFCIGCGQPMTDEQFSLAVKAAGGTCGVNPQTGAIIVVVDMNSDSDEILALCSKKNSVVKFVGIDAKVTSRGFDNLGKIKGLEELGLSGSVVTDVDMQQIGKLINLKSLVLHGPEITDESCEQLSKLTRLKSLTLGKTRMKCAKLGELAIANKLEYLDLFGAPISEEGVHQIAKIKSLKRLGLMGTDVTNQGVLELAALPKLELLQLTDSKVTSEVIGAFKARREEHMSKSMDMKPVAIEYVEVPK